MEQNQIQVEKALQAAQMYYYQDMPMKKIAAELNISHSTVSRLLNWARSHGIDERVGETDCFKRGDIGWHQRGDK